MARITVEDCIQKIPNHFDLVMLAVSRCRDLHNGEIALIEHKNKEPLIALREIADGLVIPDDLSENVIESMRKVHDIPVAVIEPVENLSNGTASMPTFQDTNVID